MFRLWDVWYIVCEKWIFGQNMYIHQVVLSEAVWCAFFILLYKPFPITRQKITYINFSARQMTWPARHNLYIVSLHTLLVWKNHPAVLPTTYISISLLEVNENLYILIDHAQIQTSKNDNPITYGYGHNQKWVWSHLCDPFIEERYYKVVILVYLQG